MNINIKPNFPLIKKKIYNISPRNFKNKMISKTYAKATRTLVQVP